MREIKFRAWSPNDRTMMYSDFRLNSGGKILSWDASTNSYDRPNDLIIPLQYTGLKDKNGKEIYEGDVFKIYAIWHSGKYEHHEVKFDYGEFTIKHTAAVDGGKWWEEGEVIGNIYERPEAFIR